MPLESLNETTLYYEREGEGPPLVLIAGYACDLKIWTAVRAILAENFSLLLIDNRGVGRSGCPGAPWSVREMAEDVVALMKRLKISKAHVLGHSMGGAIAQDLAFHHPQLVDRLVLANALIRFSTQAATAFGWLLKLRESGAPASLLIEGVLPWVYSPRFLENPENIRRTVEFFLADPHPQSLAGQRRQFEALMECDSRSWFSKIAADTLVIVSDKDICTGVTDSEQLAAGIPNARLARIPDMAHLAPVECPAEFARLVKDFLVT